MPEQTPVTKGLTKGDWWFAVLLAACLLVPVVVSGIWRSPREKPLGEYHRLGSFKLVDPLGRPITEGDLLGKISVVDFFFAGCSAQCVALSGRMAELQDLTAGLRDVQLVSITVDPEDDTPQALGRYASGINADTNRWLFLTGDRKVIYPLIQTSFLLAVAADSSDTKALTTSFIHSDKIALVDRRGVVRAYYDGLSPKTPKVVLEDIQKLLAEPAKPAQAWRALR